MGLRVGAQAGDQRRDAAVFGAADPDSALEARVELGVRLVVGDVQDIVAVDEKAARAAELLPFFEEVAVLVEDLDAAVGAVADEQPSFGIHGEGVGLVEFAGGGAFLPPGLDERPVLREFHDARIGIAAVPVGDENVAVRRGDDIRGPVEGVGAVPGDPGLAQGEQHLALGAELDDLVAFAFLAVGVGDPDVAGPVDVNAVGKGEHPGTEALEIPAGRAEPDERRERRADAGVRAAALEHPDVAAAIDVDRAGLPPFPAVGQFRPAVLAVGIVLGLRDRDHHCDRGDKSRPACASIHGYSPFGGNLFQA